MQKLKPAKPSSEMPSSIWVLGLVSMFMDASSESIHSLLPIFLVSTLHASVSYLGIIAGISESTALIVKIFSGLLSDYFGKHKLLTMMGYGLAAMSKPLFPLASSASMVLGARFIDRIGKGIRGAPRDALMGELAPKAIRGAAFGLRQSLDTVGAIVGPLLAIAGMLMLANNIRAVLWVAVIPAFISFFLLGFGIKEPHKERVKKAKTIWQLRAIRHVGRKYWQLVAAAGVLTLARISDAFLILKAQVSGLPMAWIPIVMVVMNIFYAWAAYPAGKLSDKIGRKHVLLAGVAFLAVAHVILGISTGFFWLFVGVVLWGLHLGFTQGLLAAMVSDTSPKELRGTAYGMFYLVCGLAMLVGGIAAGSLWDLFGASTMFFTGAIITCFVFVGLLGMRITKI